MNKISIGTSKEYRAVTYVINSELAKIEVERYSFDIKKIHQDNLETLTRRLEVYTNLIQQSGELIDIDEEIIVELKDKSVLKWVKTLKAPTKYSEQFVKFLNALDNLPNQVRFLYIEEPVATQYATEYDFNTRKGFSTGIDDLLLMDDDD